MSLSGRTDRPTDRQRQMPTEKLTRA